MRRDAVLLAEIISAVRRILDLTSGVSAEAIEVAPDRRDSLLWNFMVLGEAVSQLSADLKAEHSGIPWTDATRTRNRIVHGYWWSTSGYSARPRGMTCHPSSLRSRRC